MRNANVLWMLQCFVSMAMIAHPAPAAEQSDFWKLVENIREEITIDRSYDVGTTATLELGLGQAARLVFGKNSAGLTEFLFWHNAEKLHICYWYSHDDYNSTCLTSERLRDYRITRKDDAPSWMECTTKWKPGDGKAVVTFLAKSLSGDEVKKREKRRRAAALRNARRALRWDLDQVIPPFEITMDDPQDPKMIKLRTDYGLEKLVSEAADEYEKLRLILKWSRGRWEHSGNNTPSRPDPLTILKEASEGKRFRCVEYATVVAACARSLGMPSRTLALKREGVETAKSGAGHVVAEVWLKQFNKWVFVDGQWDVIPECDGVPLNGVEFQDAIAQNAPGLKMRSSSNVAKERYVVWIARYLFYFDFNLDQRFFLGDSDRSEQQRLTPRLGKVMLVPKGAINPAVFQTEIPIRNCTYISNPKVFYPAIGP